ncbi:MAG TPA: cyclic nucleotide-binding domain-containing protein [Myxococcales bacterium]|nr:cyclic nucleotide-binding domain-containing protein [Myxococcales bacterium]
MEEIDLSLHTSPGAELLQRVPLFRRLGFAETMLLSEICKIEHKPDGAVIIHQDSLGQALYILKEGAAQVKRRDPITNVEKELATLPQGELFGEMSLIDDQLVSADVIAKGPVELLVIPRKEFEALIAKNDKLAVKVYRCFCAALAERLRKANAKLGHH